MNGPRLRGHLRRGLGFALAAHVAGVWFVAVLAERRAQEAAARPDEVELSFSPENQADLPEELPPLEPAPPRAPKVAALPPAPAPEEPPPPDEVEAPPPELPPPPPPPALHRKVVDLDHDRDVEPPPDARYLAQKNNRAEVETRATDTNLERDQKGDPSSSPSDSREPDPGDGERKVARLDEQRSARGRRAPESPPEHEVEAARGGQDEARSVLAMRRAARRAHELSPETADSSLRRDPDGLRPLPEDALRASRDLRAARGDAARPRLRLSSRDYEYLFGDDAEAAERLAQREQSRRPGRFTQRMGRILSAVENFIPEVRPGNQTALNTRAAPFAAFITAVHRQIHEHWAFGFLDDLDRKKERTPFDDPSLVTKLEIVLDGAGGIAKIGVIGTSGVMAYDAAAIDVVYAAGPFPKPPPEIRSRNGKVYFHWQFHRNERACGTAGAEYFILDNPPAGGDEAGEPRPAPRTPHAEAAAGDAAGPERLERGLPRPPGAAGAPARRPGFMPSPYPSSPAPPQGGDGAGPRADPQAARAALAQVPRADDPAARALAAAWFAAYAAGDVAGMLRGTAFPFRSGGVVSARDAGELRRLYADVIAETSAAARRVRSLDVLGVAGARSLLRVLPPGFGDSPGALFAVGDTADGRMVLVLERRAGKFAIVAVERR